MKTVVPSLFTLSLSLFSLSACGGDRTARAALTEDLPGAAGLAIPAARIVPVAPAGSAPPAAPPVPEPSPGPVTELPANELGEIVVLEYHRLGEDEGEFFRSAANFRRDLETLYEKGYRPVTLRQVAEGEIDLPAGTTPVVFTIDDSSLKQFYYLEDGSIDPGTIVGIWNAFRDEHPAWRGGAVWCILPGADHPSNFFGERNSREVPREVREAAIRRKMQHLVENGHEICNHTMWHARLDRYDDAFVQEQIGGGEDSIRAYLPPDYDIVTFSLPLGVWPENRPLAWKGSYRGGKTYEYRVVLEVTGRTNPSPFDTAFDPHSVNRLIVAPGLLERQLEIYDRNPGTRFISDGDPNVVTVPQRLADRLDEGRLGGRQVRIIAEDSASEP